jgi:hypothetical protein
MNLFVKVGGKEEGLGHGCLRIWFVTHFEHMHEVGAPPALKRNAYLILLPKGLK